MYECVCVSRGIPISPSLLIRMYVCTYAHVCMYICSCMYVHIMLMYVCMYICSCMYVHMLMYVCTYAHVCMYVHMLMYVCLSIGTALSPCSKQDAQRHQRSQYSSY